MATESGEPGQVAMQHHLPEQVIQALPTFSARDETLNLVGRSVPEAIVNHSLRVYLFSKWLADKEQANFDTDQLALLFTACVCHDLGASDQFNGPQRFEVEGADAAKNHLLSHGWSEFQSHQVWTAIALHTTPGIAERIDPFTRLVRLGVLMDFSADARTRLGADDYGVQIEAWLPRLNIETELANAVVGQASMRDLPELPSKTCYPSTLKHPAASWPGMLLRAHLENPRLARNPAF